MLSENLRETSIKSLGTRRVYRPTEQAKNGADHELTLQTYSCEWTREIKQTYELYSIVSVRAAKCPPPAKKKPTILLCKWKATFRNFKWHWDGTLLCRIVLTTFVIPLKPAVASECPWCDLPVWTSNGVSRPRAKHARTEPTSMGSPKAVPARVYKICKYLWSTLHWTWLAGRSPYEPLLYALLIARKCSQAL